MRRPAPGRCDMAGIRIVSISVASAAAIGLSGAIGLAPSATALSCSAPDANVAPPANAVVTAPGGKTLLPVRGQRPRGANDRAPLPRRGLLSPGTRQTAPLQQQAATPQRQAAVPPPAPPNP